MMIVAGFGGFCQSWMSSSLACRNSDMLLWKADSCLFLKTTLKPNHSPTTHKHRPWNKWEEWSDCLLQKESIFSKSNLQTHFHPLKNLLPPTHIKYLFKWLTEGDALQIHTFINWAQKISEWSQNNCLKMGKLGLFWVKRQLIRTQVEQSWGKRHFWITQKKHYRLWRKHWVRSAKRGHWLAEYWLVGTCIRKVKRVVLAMWQLK